MVMLALTLVLGCSGGEMREHKNAFTSIKDVPEATWQKLSQKKIYFGHQSVGNNIIAGLHDVIKENPKIKLNIVEINSASDLSAPMFGHSKIGENLNPASKLEGFVRTMKNGLGNKADIAFFKFCYVDVSGDTDVETLFNKYKGIMSDLEKQYLRTKFLHVTIPLTTVQEGFKVWIKQIIGKPIPYGYADNMKREEYNQLVHREYAGKQAIFDLAKIESTLPDGNRADFIWDTRTYFRMAPEFTYDEGHLNEKGRKIAAEQLLVLLANLCD
jgi:hypothetical protein